MTSETQGADGAGTKTAVPEWPDSSPNPTPEELASPQFEAVWQTIQSWDICIPEEYGGYCGATGSHVVRILRALSAATPAPAAQPAGQAGDAGAAARANLFEMLWRDAEDEAQRLEAGMKPSRNQIAEAFHEHRRERQPNLPQWSEVDQNSGAAKFAHAFVDRLLSIRPEEPSPNITRTGAAEAQGADIEDRLSEILTDSQRQDLSDRLLGAYMAPHGGLRLDNAEVAYLWTKLGGAL